MLLIEMGAMESASVSASIRALQSVGIRNIKLFPDYNTRTALFIFSNFVSALLQRKEIAELREFYRKILHGVLVFLSGSISERKNVVLSGMAVEVAEKFDLPRLHRFLDHLLYVVIAWVVKTII